MSGKLSFHNFQVRGQTDHCHLHLDILASQIGLQLRRWDKMLCCLHKSYWAIFWERGWDTTNTESWVLEEITCFILFPKQDYFMEYKERWSRLNHLWMPVTLRLKWAHKYGKITTIAYQPLSIFTSSFILPPSLVADNKEKYINMNLLCK